MLQNSWMSNKKHPCVSVIIPSYNRANYLPEALDSVLAQTYQDFEVIVVDDGSTDNTESAVFPYLSRIRYVKQNNSERSAARNHGIRLASGEFIAFLDSDDFWRPSKLEKQVAFLKKHPDVDLVYTWLDICDMGGRPLKLVKDGRPLTTQHGASVFYPLLLRNFVVGGATTVMARRSAIELAGGFDEGLRHVEDWDLWLRMALRGQFGFIPESLAFYRVNHANVYEKQSRLNVQDSYLNVIEKNLSMIPEALLDDYQRRVALAQAHWYVAKLYYSVSRIPEGQDNLLQAIRLDPEFFSNSNSILLEDLASWANNLYEDGNTPEIDALRLLNRFFRNLPVGTEPWNDMRSKTLSLFHASRFFQGVGSDDSGQSRHDLVTMIRHNPRWLLNRGVWILGLRALMANR